MNKNLTIHVPNVSVMCLYEWELTQQISNGKYENTRPHNHWKWINNVKDVIVDDLCGISADENSYNTRFGWNNLKKNYNIDEWITYIKRYRCDRHKNKDYGWAVRAIAYGKFGRIHPTMTYSDISEISTIKIFLENLQLYIEETGETDPQIILKHISNFSDNDWRKTYYLKCKKYLSVSFIKKFIKCQYDIDELTSDLTSLSLSVNTKI